MSRTCCSVSRSTCVSGSQTSRVWRRTKVYLTALRFPVGDQAAQFGQLMHLAYLSDLPHVTIQISPTSDTTPWPALTALSVPEPAPGQVLATPLLLREPGSGTRETLDAALGDHVTPALELGSTAALRAAALSGTAPAVLSVLAVDADLADRRLVEIRVAADLRRVLRAVWPRGVGLPAAARHLLAVGAKNPGLSAEASAVCQ
jgi:hypothetical protein